MSKNKSKVEIIHFANDAPIELDYTNTKVLVKGSYFDEKAIQQGYVWHQIVINHKGKFKTPVPQQKFLDAICEIVAPNELYPIAYRVGAMEDRFLVRQCHKALHEIFAKKIYIHQIAVELQIQLNVGRYKDGQISANDKIARALNERYAKLETVNGHKGILNLSQFAQHPMFADIVVDLRNYGVFKHICESIYKNDEKFFSIEGIILSNNRLTCCKALDVFRDCSFVILDLRDNLLDSAVKLCEDLKNIKAAELRLAGNPLTRSYTYLDSITKILKNFPIVDGSNQRKEYTSITSAEKNYNGYRIDYTNKRDISRAEFANSGDWHAVMIPDPLGEYTKDEIFDFFFIMVSPNHSLFYPCYYKFTSEEHRFYVRNCHDQLKYLVEEFNLEIKIPSFTDQDADVLQVEFAKTLPYYLQMNIIRYEKNHIEPDIMITKALNKRFSMMDRLLDLNNFQMTEELEDLIVKLSSPKILVRVLLLASRKFMDRCKELHLSNNKILSVNCANILNLMPNLRAIDLSNNSIQRLKDIRDLKNLDITSLNLDGNPLCDRYNTAEEYIRAVLYYFPKVTKLDNTAINEKRYLKAQKNYLYNTGDYDFINEFVKYYFTTFESKHRETLENLYLNNSILTMTCYYKDAQSSSHLFKRLCKYDDPSRNIFKMSDLQRAYATVHFGAKQIIKLFKSLPKVQFDMHSFSTDSTVFNDNLIVTVNGVFIDEGITSSALEPEIKMAFSRTFVLSKIKSDVNNKKFPGSSIKCYQIVNEAIHITKPTSIQLKQCFKFTKNIDDNNKSKELTMADKQTLLLLFQQITKLKTFLCTRYLKDANWNFDTAIDIVEPMIKNGEIPQTAFNFSL